MNRTMITATNTMSQLQLKLDLISNNMANINTTGFKSKEGTFSQLLYQQFDNQPLEQKEKGRLTPDGIRLGVGAYLGMVKLNLAQGSLKTTDRELDVALTKPDLFFKVQPGDSNENTVQYTRDGTFYLSPSSNAEDQFNLVTANGDYILNQLNEPIVISGQVNNISISEEGTLLVNTNNGNQQFDLGVISVKNPQYMERKSGNLLALTNNFAALGINEGDIYTDLVGMNRQNISMTQGALESSNVDMSKEMTELINTQRQYQFQSRSVTLADQMMGLINGVR